MSRVPLTELIFKGSNPVRVAAGVAVSVFERDGSTPVGAFSAEVEGTEVSQPLTTSRSGQPVGPKGEQVWIEAGSYTLRIGTIVVPFEASKGVVTLGVEQVETSNLKDTSVTAGKLANQAVEVGKIKEEAVTGNKLHAESVQTSKIVAGAVTAEKLASESVETATIKNEAVTAGKLGTASVTAAKIAAGAVEEAKLGNLSVATEKLANLAVSNSKLAANAVETTKIKNEAVTKEKLSAAVQAELEHEGKEGPSGPSAAPFSAAGLIAFEAVAGSRYFSPTGGELKEGAGSMGSQVPVMTYLRSGVKYKARGLFTVSAKAPGGEASVEVKRVTGFPFAYATAQLLFKSGALPINSLVEKEAEFEVTTAGWYVPIMANSAKLASESAIGVFFSIGQ
ncbi:MAG: hypothetical protein ACRDPE_23410 [Solirubrobacterales bacterium]